MPATLKREQESPGPGFPSFATVQSILPNIGITARRVKQLNSVLLIREQREQRKQDVAFNARPFVLCSIPLCPVPKDQLVYKRRNGNFFLHIVSHPDFGLPFGQDRLIPIWVATLALRQKSREVYFDSAAQMLDFFRLPKDGFHYRRLVEGFKRMFGATIFFGTEERPGANEVIDAVRFHFFDSIKLWYSSAEQGSGSEPRPIKNVVRLSETFYKEIDEHRIPVEREVVSSLAYAPGILDFYFWLAWKSWTVNGTPRRIPIVAPAGLCNQLGAKQYSSPRSFRHLIIERLVKVKAYWPDCPAFVTNDRRFLIVHSSRKSPAIRIADSRVSS